MLSLEDLYQIFISCGRRISTDTRLSLQDSIFFAIKGERFDGNTLAEQALSQGAAYAVVDNPKYNTSPQTILVQDTLRTLQDLAAHHRQVLKTRIIAITGSNGKTTTKELMAAVLSKKYNTVATIGNLNNHIGVPLTLLKLEKSTEILVLEMGANHLKEIEHLCQIASPDYGYITNFGKAHLKGFGSEAGVIQGKSELYKHLMAKKLTIFYNADDAVQQEILKTYTNKYGFSFSGGHADVSLTKLPPRDFAEVSFDDDLICSQLIGSYNANNIAAALAVGSYFNVAKEDLKAAIESYKPSNNRSQVLQKNSNKIIADAYNANPSSMKAALVSFSKQQGDKLAILGDMFELGDVSAEEHQNIADFVKDLGLDALLVGEAFFNVQTDFKKLKTVEEAIAFMSTYPPSQKTILIKGSRSMTLERLFDVIP